MADYFPLLSRTIASLGNSTPEQRQIVYERARGVVADQLSAIEPPMDSEAIKRELSLFEAAVMRLEHEMKSLEAIKPQPLPGENETRKHISARLSALLAKAAAARAATTQDLLTRDIEPTASAQADDPDLSGTSQPSHATPRVTVDRVPEPLTRSIPHPSAPMVPQVVDRNTALPPLAGEAGTEPVPETVLPPDPQASDSESVEIAAVPSPEVALAAPLIEADQDDEAGPEHQAESDPYTEAERPSEAVDPAVPLSDAEPLQTASPQPRGPLGALLGKAQGLWQKKPQSVGGEPHSATGTELPPSADEGQASLFAEQPADIRMPAVQDPARPVVPLSLIDEEFVGPVLPVADPVVPPDDGSGPAGDVPLADHVSSVASPLEGVTGRIAISEADERTSQDDGQAELPFLSPPKPAPASEIELLDDGRPRLAQRRKRDRGLFRGLVMGLAFVSVIAAVAGTAWVLRDRPADFEQSATATRTDLSRKITDRLPSEAVVVSSGVADPVAGGAAVAAAGQRVMLFEEGVEGQPEPLPVKGRVTWALDTIRDQTGAGDVAIKADIKDLSGSLTAVTMVIKRNRDIGFPASHLIELNFTTPDNSPNGRVRDIATPEMRAEEGVRGTSLFGLPVPVTENVFLVGLTNLPDRIEQNRDLLRNRNWIVVPMRFANGRRAVMMVEKGLVGDRVLLDAFQAWK